MHSEAEERLGLAVLIFLAVKRKNTPTERDVLKALGSLFAVQRAQLTAVQDALVRVIEGLQEQGQLERNGARLSLTKFGKARCRAAFGIAVPSSKPWVSLKKHLVAAAMLPPDRVGDGANRLAGGAGLASVFLNEQRGVIAGRVPTAMQVADALAWRELGGAPDVNPSWKAARELLLGRILGVERLMPMEKALVLLAARDLGCTKASHEALQGAVLRRWVQPGADQSLQVTDRPVHTGLGADAQPVQQQPGWYGDQGNGPSAANGALESSSEGGAVDPSVGFVAAVLRAACDPRTTLFGDRKAYLASVFEVYCEQHGHESWERFGARLIEAHQNGELRLARADLVPAMDRRLVDRSELSYENATFHFVEVR